MSMLGGLRLSDNEQWHVTGVPRKSTELMTQGEKIIKQMTNSEKRWQELVVRGGPSGKGIENYELRHPGVANTSDASSWNNTHFKAFWLHREIQHCHFGIPTARNKSTHPIPYSIDFLFPNWLLGKAFLCHPETVIYIWVLELFWFFMQVIRFIRNDNLWHDFR